MSSVAFDKIVPLGQDFILDDIPVTLALEEWVRVFLCLIGASVDRREYRKPSLGSCPGSQLAGLLDSVEHCSAPSSGHLREEPMLDGVPFGAVRRVMGNPDVYAESLCQLDETPFPLPAPCVIGPASVTEDEDGLCAWVYMPETQLPLLCYAVAGELCRIMVQTKSHIAGVPVHVVDAVRNHLAVGKRGKVMVFDLHGLFGVGGTVVASEVSEEFLLLRVYAEHGNAFLPALFTLSGNVAKLHVTICAFRHCLHLCRLAACVSLSRDNLPYCIKADVYMIFLGEYILNLRGGQTEPLRVGILRKPCDVKLHYLSENVDVLGMLGERTLPASSLFANPALFEVLFGLKFMATSVDRFTVYAKDAADKAHSVLAMPVGDESDELPRLSFVCVFEVLHFFVFYYICWNLRNLHNCVEFSYKGTDFSADLRI